MADAERTTRNDPVLGAFRRDVLRVFGGDKCPPRDEIAPHDCPECNAICRAFAGVGWRRVPDGLIEAYPSCLPLFSPAAYHYFLPSYLLYALDHLTSNAMPTEHLVYDLAIRDHDDEGMIDYVRERLRPFTRDEIELAARFLELVDTDESFRRYHGEVEPGRQRLLAHWEARWNS